MFGNRLSSVTEIGSDTGPDRHLTNLRVRRTDCFPHQKIRICVPCTYSEFRVASLPEPLLFIKADGTRISGPHVQPDSGLIQSFCNAHTLVKQQLSDFLRDEFFQHVQAFHFACAIIRNERVHSVGNYFGVTGKNFVHVNCAENITCIRKIAGEVFCSVCLRNVIVDVGNRSTVVMRFSKADRSHCCKMVCIVQSRSDDRQIHR